ncbi:hypothetical protein TNCT_150721 [Trichonephila clavata]|uniref:Uncharacterized protein n=1 Tax=Trichonephila clavata TaxID=2740835 RepID=A0A8X6HRP4_TRICU|nr:hypothetical protein TNCT_150721 [Trichonephila clavata]
MFSRNGLAQSKLLKKLPDGISLLKHLPLTVEASFSLRHHKRNPLHVQLFSDLRSDLKPYDRHPCCEHMKKKGIIEMFHRKYDV